MYFVRWFRTRNTASLFFLLVSTLAMLIGMQSFSGTAYAVTATLAWNPSTSTGVTGYKVYYGTSSGNYNQIVDVGSQTSAAIPDLSEGQTYYFAVKSYDAFGDQSAFSPEIKYTVNDLAEIPQSQMTIQYVDSQELFGSYSPAKYAIDGHPSTFWHTEWYDASPEYPHEIVINLNGLYRINGFRYLPRQDGCPNGTVANYSFYVSADGVNWTLAATGKFGSGSGSKQVLFSGVDASYVKLVGLSEINGNPWMSAAEINVLGTPVNLTVLPDSQMSVVSADSQELSCGYYPAEYAIDGNPSTFWHTQFYPSSPGYPHDIVISLGGSYDIMGFQYLPRQDGWPNGRVSKFNFYVSMDGVHWGNPVVTGAMANNSSQKEVLFSGKMGAYVKLEGLSEVNGNAWMSAAEIKVLTDQGD